MTELAHQPAITITVMDYDRICGIAEGAIRDAPDVATFLLAELGRANIALQPPHEPAVRMQSTVYYRDAAGGAVQRIRLVYPDEADSRRGYISILTPIGAALIGLSAGQTIEWRDRRGNRRALTVLAIQDDPDAPILAFAG